MPVIGNSAQPWKKATTLPRYAERAMLGAVGQELGWVDRRRRAKAKLGAHSNPLLECTCAIHGSIQVSWSLRRAAVRTAPFA